MVDKESFDEFAAALGADVVIPVETTSPPGSVAQILELRDFYDRRQAVLRAARALEEAGAEVTLPKDWKGD